ncbi:MAG: 3-phosphoshikimate 1-carboxyvinyltransferase [Mogibacterium sp.]|nr:3-phosphoshikimate 1-carboxyvinyltransferase [Mogibacterium sp.]
MLAIIEKSELRGSVPAEPSKSMAHRLLIAAALAGGMSRIVNVAGSEDVLATADCLRALGAEPEFVRGGNGEADYCEVKGFDPSLSESAELPCRESGSTLRFLMPVAALSGKKMRFSGSETLMTRPLTVYEDIFRKMGMSLERGSGYIEIEGKLKPGEYEIDADISSQFVSGLLFALPLADGDSTLILKGRVESRPYIDMTIEALDIFGVRIEKISEGVLHIPGGQTYGNCDVAVEGDWSNAAFFLAMGVDVRGLREDSLQGDKVCRAHFERLERGCAEIDISDCPDLGPVLMAHAAMHEGCMLTGTRRLSIKESDRGAAMKEELAKFGVDVRIHENSIEVGAVPHENGAYAAARLHAPTETLCGHNDHRIVMALAILASRTGGRIEGAEAVRKSFPNFFERFAEAGGICKIETD